ncbi:MAG: hypothetical protein GYB68_17290 [Chloroflexi bacterium]|nr:hypothetical protein [Chloroflexota bacterium]
MAKPGDPSIRSNLLKDFIDHPKYDKPRNWTLLFIAFLVPFTLCWIVPNAFAMYYDSQEAQSEAEQAAERIAFEANYADLIHVCQDSDPDLAALGRPAGAALNVLVIENSRPSDIQAQLPAEWQPDDPLDVLTVFCISRQRVQPLNACSSEPIDPLINERSLLHYVVDIMVYDVALGSMSTVVQLNGGEPFACSPDYELPAEGQPFDPDDFYGPRIPDEVLSEWVLSYFDG